MKMAAAYGGFNIENGLLLSWPKIKMYCTPAPSYPVALQRLQNSGKTI